MPSKRRQRAVELLAQGHTQRKVAELLGVHQSTVSRWIGGRPPAPPGSSSARAQRVHDRRRAAGLCRCGAAPKEGATHCVRCLENDRKRTARARAKLVAEVVAAYGGRCECCGEDEPRFLTVDHPNDDGAQHRRDTGGGSHFYTWLRRQGFPPEYRLLCFNCNIGRARNGGVCPHERRLRAVG